MNTFISKGAMYMNNAQCRSIFKGGTEHTDSKAVTEIWIKLINRLEKSSLQTNKIREE